MRRYPELCIHQIDGTKDSSLEEAVRASTKYQRLQVILPSRALFALKSHGGRLRFSGSIDLVLLRSFYKDSRRNRTLFKTHRICED
ncbi:hypothetical protein CDAR_71331 [Caerostris darwini]|uniref:Uncharacterized protein n=1 Tax=Caerostris darwini TaxID=1538125 RepID=A0AAV4WES4_9ARAC|nr:hypothetical protein CDAR_71331 [Caerostris darwini]